MEPRRVAIALLVAVLTVVWAPTALNGSSIALASDALSLADALVPDGGGDPLSCLQRASTPAIEHVTTARWAPNGERLALERIVTIPSTQTVTGFEEEVRVLELDLGRGEVRDLGEASHPQWSGTGTYLSRWRDGLRVTRDGRQVARLEPSTPALRWVGDTLFFWDLNEIKSWSAADGVRVVSTVDPAFEPYYPRDDVDFSADGTLFTLTRYRMDGAADRWVGETRTGQLAPLSTEGTVYTEWAPTGATLLARSAGQIELRGEQGWRRSAPLAAFPGPVHGWTPDGRLLLGAITPTVPGGTTFDRFDVWDGDAVVANALLPNLLGARSFSADGRFFAGTQRTSLYGSELAVFSCGAAAAPRADPSARSRHDRIAGDARRFVRPVAGAISQFLQGAHTGIDVAAPVGALITAADEGVVTMVGWHTYGGRTVCVQHAAGLESCYYHTSIAYVVVGERVARGQPVAAVGMTGLTTGPHLHWEVKRDGAIVDPLGH